MKFFHLNLEILTKTCTLPMLAVLLITDDVFGSECWVIDNFKGYAAKGYSNYKFQEDGMTTTKYVLVIDGKNSHVVGGDITEYIQVSQNSVIAAAVDNGTSVIETWTVDPESKKALYTKTAQGYGPLDGVSAFVGDVIGSCRNEKLMPSRK